MDKGAKRTLEDACRWLLQPVCRFCFRFLGRDALGTLADWAGRKIGGVVCLAVRTGETEPRRTILLQCMRVSSYLRTICSNRVASTLTERVRRVSPRDEEPARPVSRRATL